MKNRTLVCTSILCALFFLVAGSTAVMAKTWKYQSVWPASILLNKPDKYFGDLIDTLAGDDLDLKYYDGGSLVQTGEVFDAVANGIVEMATDWPSYWDGKNTAFSLLTSVPMGFAPADYMIWYWQGGGFELSQELYGKYGIVFFPHGLTSPESGQRSNKPIKSLEDYKGVKMRQCGRVQANMLNDVGGSAIFMPGGEVYLSLQRGTIDAGEFSVPEVDWVMGFQEITKYWVLPGWHQPGPIWGVLINKKAFDALSDETKFKFKEAAMATMMWSWTYFEYGSGAFTNKFIEAGTEISRLDEKVLEQLQQDSWKYMIEDAEKNPDFAKIAYSQAAFLKNMKLWREIQSPFTYSRTPSGLDEAYDKLKAIAEKHGVRESADNILADVRERMTAQKFWTPGTEYINNPVSPK
ncbi:MAG: TRAP transporter substrate-binding protein DctP [Desulfocapsaceae bacterium]|jgi:TRAP-type mannitol/chloroaromatic compound transport system substrate-binding protein|nr:TRAP transporter substrate-binding protein DctP [Desulfocapsaceae bacterium]